MGLKVLLTGHLGYIGTVMIERLLEHGHTVVGADTGYFTDCLLEPLVRHVPGSNRTDARTLRLRHLDGVDAVIHLAALSNDPLGELDPALTDAINHQASVRLARLAREAGIQRFIFSSSCSLYGAADNAIPLGENAPFNPVSAYAVSKVRAEAGIAALATPEFSPVFLRNATAFGLSPRFRFDLVANNLVGSALTTGTIRLQSDGSPWRPLVHVEDICQACIACLNAPREAIHNQAFNIGRNDQNFQVRDIAEEVRRAVPGSRVEFAPNAGPDRRSYRVCFDKAERGLPGFRPQWDLAGGIEQMVRFFRDRGLTAVEFQGRAFSRLAQLRYLLDTGRVNAELYWAERRAIPL